MAGGKRGQVETMAMRRRRAGVVRDQPRADRSEAEAKMRPDPFRLFHEFVREAEGRAEGGAKKGSG